MAARIIGSSWWVDFRFNQTRYRKRSPENSRAGAQAYEATLRQKLGRGEDIDQIDKTNLQRQSFEQFARTWFEEYAVPNNKRSEQLAKKYILSASLVPFFGKMVVGHITTHHIEQYKAREAKRGAGNKTINNYLTVLSTCIKAAYEWLELSNAPPKIKLLKCPPPHTDHLSMEENELLLSHAEGVVYELVLTALRTGMRQSELTGLQWTSIDWQNRILTVRHSLCRYRKILTSPKSNRERHIPLDPEIYDLLSRRKKNTGYVFLDSDIMPFNQRRLSHRLNGLCKKAGIRRITWHILRHTFATQLAMKGAPLNTVQSLLGHSSITTTMRYSHVVPSTLRTAIELLNPDSSHSPQHGQPAGNAWQDQQLKKAA
jgi:integrase